MTRLSRPPARRRVKGPQSAALPRLCASWHALCTLSLASGCLYLGPIPTLEDNVPPVAIEYSATPGDTIQIVGIDGQAVYVVAADEDGDDIGFVWALSADGVIGDATPLNFPSGEGSQVHLDRDPELNGQVLTCYIDDGQSELVVLRWELEVP